MNRNNKLAVCITASLALLGCNQAQVLELQPERQNPLQVVKVNQANHTTNKHFSGIVRAHETVNVAFRIPGTLSHLYVQTGESVSKGDLIAELDPHDYQVALEELEAKMLEAQSAHKLAKAELRRVKQATQDNAIASVNLDRATSGYERSLSAIKVVEKNIQRAKDTLSYTKLVAPFDGVIGRVDFKQHEQVLPGIAVVTIQDQSKFDVEVDVPENMIQDFNVGDISNLSWYQSEAAVQAHVTEVSPVPHLIKQTYTVTYTVDSEHPSLFEGKSVTISTAHKAKRDTHCVPYSAVVGEKEELHVNIVRNNTVIYTPVELRSLDAYQACVAGDLQDEDYIVVSGSHYLQDGDKADSVVLRTN